ncbi:MAG: hypothetical protein CMH30_03470 [Micavibrio sp.]|nr:hypothetical protein [Micavibrio sp.]|tara:strand:+ start:2329 stop:2550 length:222 start_codon:yes stop_codon:yes gene_type:complete
MLPKFVKRAYRKRDNFTTYYPQDVLIVEVEMRESEANANDPRIVRILNELKNIKDQALTTIGRFDRIDIRYAK